MTTILCTNGNCTQEHCILRHLGPPPPKLLTEGSAVGISDRAPNQPAHEESERRKTMEEEDIRKSKEESLREAFSCRYCGLKLDDFDCLQLHSIDCTELCGD